MFSRWARVTGCNSRPLPTSGTGVYGASYQAAAGLYKNINVGGISYQPNGYDGVDNDGNGMVDDIAEGIPSSTDQTTFATALAGAHKHATARAEVLYALLVEGTGPLGSVFSPDEFSSKEVQDTDGDGMPEFVDAWGQPLQFFRWPLLYHSDIQRGQVVTTTAVTGFGSGWTLSPPYATVFQTREQDPLDLNQQLVAPGWWTGAFNGNWPSGYSTLTTGASYSGITPTPSGGVLAIEYFFHRITEPMPAAAPAVQPHSGIAAPRTSRAARSTPSF